MTSLRSRWRGITTLACGLVLYAGAAWAQPRSDEQVWLSAEGQAVVTKRLRLGVEQQLRLDEQASGFDQTHTELSVAYRLRKFLSVGAGYRFIVRGAEERRHRGMADAALSHDLGPVELQYRFRVQMTTREMDTQTVLRNRVRAAIDLPHRLMPFAAAEVHHVVDPGQELRELRGYLGLDWEATRAVELQLFYLHQRELNVNVPERNHILGMGFRYRFRT